MSKVTHGGPLRVAVIGAGRMANSVHYPSLASLSDVAISGICDVDPDHLSRTADLYHLENRYADYRRMVEEVAPDAIYAIGQPHQMFDVWLWCLQQKQNLYIEKPLGLTIHQARTLTYLAAQNDCLTQVRFQRRACPMIVMLRDECLKRGPIVHAVCRFYKNEIKQFASARDHMLDDGVHAIDTLRWICGGEVARIQSVTKRVLVPDLNFIAAVIEFDNGATGLMLNSWSSGRRIFDVEMHAPGICVEANPEGNGILYADGDIKGIRFNTRDVAASNDNFVYGGFQAKHREFAACLRSGKQPGSNFADALKTMEVAEKILAQNLLRGD